MVWFFVCKKLGIMHPKNKTRNDQYFDRVLSRIYANYWHNTGLFLDIAILFFDILADRKGAGRSLLPLPPLYSLAGLLSRVDCARLFPILPFPFPPLPVCMCYLHMFPRFSYILAFLIAPKLTFVYENGSLFLYNTLLTFIYLS